MNKKALIKYKHGNEQGLMHYVIFEGEVVVLSREQSHKVDHIKKFGTLDVTFDVTKKEFDPIKVSANTDKDYVKKVYTYMIETNNAYFTDGYDDLCVLKFDKK